MIGVNKMWHNFMIPETVSLIKHVKSKLSIQVLAENIFAFRELVTIVGVQMILKSTRFWEVREAELYLKC